MKTCHFIWTTGSPMSYLQTLSVKSFDRLNPDWNIIIWLIKQNVSELGKNIYTPDYTGWNYFNSLSTYRIKEVDLVEEGIGLDKHGILASDILRIKLLHKYGGLYSDFDTLWLRSMTEFKNIDCIGNPEDFETTVCIHESGHHNNSNILSEPGGDYLKTILELQKEIKPPYTHQAFNTDLLNANFPKWEEMVEKWPRLLKIVYSTFYPYSIFEMGKLYEDTDLTPIDDKVMALHWFNGHYLSQRYIKEFGKSCSMTSILKREGWL